MHVHHWWTWVKAKAKSGAPEWNTDLRECHSCVESGTGMAVKRSRIYQRPILSAPFPGPPKRLVVCTLSLVDSRSRMSLACKRFAKESQIKHFDFSTIGYDERDAGLNRWFSLANNGRIQPAVDIWCELKTSGCNIFQKTTVEIVKHNARCITVVLPCELPCKRNRDEALNVN